MALIAALGPEAPPVVVVDELLGTSCVEEEHLVSRDGFSFSSPRHAPQFPFLPIRKLVLRVRRFTPALNCLIAACTLLAEVEIASICDMTSDNAAPAFRELNYLRNVHISTMRSIDGAEFFSLPSLSSVSVWLAAPTSVRTQLRAEASIRARCPPQASVTVRSPHLAII
jgi:hypothetical protein